MERIPASVTKTVKQQSFTVAAMGIEMALTYGAMPIFIRALPPEVYTTIVFVIGGGVGFIATHITKTLLKSQRVCVLNSIREEKIRGAIYLTLLTIIATLAMVLRL
jgi:ribosome biogenesis SPOUT family RNA methylase Rps3